MSPATTQPLLIGPDDPWEAALCDSKVRKELHDHALAVLRKRLADRSVTVWSEAADDAVQTTHMRALQKKQDYDPSAGSVPSWLHGIMNHVLSETIRSLYGLPSQAAADASAWEQLTRDLGRQASDSVPDRLAADYYMAKLPAECRQIMALRFYEDLSHDEIAVRLGISPGAARVRLCRALVAAKTIAGVVPGEDRR